MRLTILVGGGAGGRSSATFRPNQTEDKLFGDGPVEELHAWFSDEENAAELDLIVAAGAFDMGRNMFGPWSRRRHGRPAG